MSSRNTGREEIGPGKAARPDLSKIVLFRDGLAYEDMSLICLQPFISPLYFMESNKDLTWMSYDNSVSSARISLRYSTSIITSAKIQLHASPSGSMPQCQCNSGRSNTTTWLTLRGSIAAQEKIRTLTYAAGLIGHHAFYILVVGLLTWTSCPNLVHRITVVDQL